MFRFSVFNVFFFLFLQSFYFFACSFLFPFHAVCIIIPLTPGSTETAFILKAQSPIFPTPTPTPPPTPLTSVAAANRGPFSLRHSPSYESSISLEDLAPLAPLEPFQSNFLPSHSSRLAPQNSSAESCQSPAFSFLPGLSSPIPLITSPLPYSAPHSPSPFSNTSVSTSLSIPATPTSIFSPAETVTLSLTLSDQSCQTTHTIKTTSTPTIFTAIHSSGDPNLSQLIATPVTPILSSAPPSTSPSISTTPSNDSLVAQLASSSSRPVSPLSVCTLPPISPSGSYCSSPSPPSPPLRSLSPCPVCQCKCVPSVTPPPARTHNDASKMEIFI